MEHLLHSKLAQTAYSSQTFINWRSHDPRVSSIVWLRVTFLTLLSKPSSLNIFVWIMLTLASLYSFINDFFNGTPFLLEPVHRASGMLAQSLCKTPENSFFLFRCSGQTLPVTQFPFSICHSSKVPIQVTDSLVIINFLLQLFAFIWIFVLISILLFQILYGIHSAPYWNQQQISIKS